MALVLAIPRISTWVVVATVVGLGCQHRVQTRAPVSLASAPRMSVDAASTCVVQDDGAVDCWGAIPSDLAPKLESVAGTIRSLDRHGPTWGCATTSAGDAWCWTGGWDDSPARALPSLEDVSDLAGSCVVHGGGRLACWERFFFGSVDQIRRPRDVLEVDAGEGTTCWRDARGRVACNYFDKLTRRLAVRGAVHIAAAGGTTWAVLEDGRVVRELFSTRRRYRMVSEVEGLDDATAVDGTSTHGCALRGDGTVSCWTNGRNAPDPLLPDLHHPSSDMATPIVGVDDAVEIVVGDQHACALERSGGLRCWGSNHNFELGDRRGQPWVQSPTVVDGFGPATSVHVGARHACARRGAGQLWCWGELASFKPDDELAQYVGRSGPVLVAHDLNEVLTADGLTCNFAATGSLDCWGRALGHAWWTGGRVPLAAATDRVTLDGRWGCGAGPGGVECFDITQYLHAEPDFVPLEDTVMRAAIARYGGGQPPGPISLGQGAAPIAIDVNDARACAVLEGGAAYCWSLPSSEPEPIQGLPPLASISVGRAQTCGLSTQGDAWCWADSNAAARIPRLGPLVTVVSGTERSCSLTDEGKVLCWGEGPDAAPVEVAGARDIISLAIGGATTCTVDHAGVVRCWGDNRLGKADPASPPSSAVALEVDPARLVRIVEGGG